MATRNLSIRLSVKDGEIVKRALSQLGAEGERALRRIEKSAQPASHGLDLVDRSSRRVQAGMDRVSDTLNRHARTAIGLVGAYVSLQAAQQGFAALLATNVERQGLIAGLETTEGSAEAARAKMAELVEFAKTTPFALNQSVEAWVKMKNLGLDPTTESMAALGNVSAAMNKDLSQMIEAVADASTFEFERLKEFGITARQEGDKVRLTFRGVTTELNKNSKEIVQYLTDIGRVEFAGAMERQMEKLPGKLSNLQDSLDSVKAAIGEGGFNQAVGDAADKISDLLQTIEQNGTADEIGKKLGGAISSLANAGIELGKAFGPSLVTGINNTAAALGNLAKEKNNLQEIANLLETVNTIAGMIGGVITYPKRAIAAFQVAATVDDPVTRNEIIAAAMGEGYTVSDDIQKRIDRQLIELETKQKQVRQMQSRNRREGIDSLSPGSRTEILHEPARQRENLVSSAEQMRTAVDMVVDFFTRRPQMEEAEKTGAQLRDMVDSYAQRRREASAQQVMDQAHKDIDPVLQGKKPAGQATGRVGKVVSGGFGSEGGKEKSDPNAKAIEALEKRIALAQELRNKGERAEFVLQHAGELTAEASREQRAEVERLAGQYFDLQEQLKEFEKQRALEESNEKIINGLKEEIEYQRLLREEGEKAAEVYRALAQLDPKTPIEQRDEIKRFTEQAFDERTLKQRNEILYGGEEIANLNRLIEAKKRGADAYEKEAAAIEAEALARQSGLEFSDREIDTIASRLRKQKELEKSLEHLTTLQQDVNHLFSSMDFVYENYRRTVGKLEEAQAAGLLKPEEFARLRQQVENEFNGITQAAVETAQFSRDAMNEMFFGLLEGDLHDFGERLRSGFNRIMSNLITNAITAQLEKGFGRSLERLFSSLFSFGSAVTVPTAPAADLPSFGGYGGIDLNGVDFIGGARASGGGVRAGKIYQINEYGQEYFIPDVDGYVLPQHAGSALRDIDREMRRLAQGRLPEEPPLWRRTLDKEAQLLESRAFPKQPAIAARPQTISTVERVESNRVQRERFEREIHEISRQAEARARGREEAVRPRWEPLTPTIRRGAATPAVDLAGPRVEAVRQAVREERAPRNAASPAVERQNYFNIPVNLHFAVEGDRSLDREVAFKTRRAVGAELADLLEDGGRDR